MFAKIILYRNNGDKINELLFTPLSNSNADGFTWKVGRGNSVIDENGGFALSAIQIISKIEWITPTGDNLNVASDERKG